MSWAIGYDENWMRDIGYGVPAMCDYPGCGAEIDRGLSYVCGGEPSPDSPAWVRHKLTHPSWAHWRKHNAAEVQRIIDFTKEQQP